VEGRRGAVKSYVFRVEVEEDTFPDGRKGYHASCPALAGCRAYGHTEKEAFANIQEAIQAYAANLRKAGKPIPVDPKLGTIELPGPCVIVNV